MLDFGSQYAQLIARRVREQNVYCEIVRHDITAARVRELAPKGIILSGGPASVYADGAPQCDPAIFRARHSGARHLLRHAAGLRGARRPGAESRRSASTAGPTARSTTAATPTLFAGVPRETEVWMSHGDQVDTRVRRLRAARPHEHLPASPR